MRLTALFAVLTSLAFAHPIFAQEISAGVGATADESTENSASSTPLAVTVFSDRVAFDAVYPQASRANFDNLIGSSAPFGAGPVRVFGNVAPATGPKVVDQLVGLPASFWFGAQTQSSSFVISNFVAQIKIRGGANAIGMDIQCFGCDSAGGTPAPVNMTVFNPAGQLIYSTLIFPQGLTGMPSGVPEFLGISANRPIGSVVVERYSNWLFANLRYEQANR
ncbi:MAG: hypothetical protein J0I77_17955 [Rudaea sp.]|nr:hypothetical protein [Rudaea sp.]MBN8887614.1 hypothetical protein [Rudaea sp.]